MNVGMEPSVRSPGTVTLIGSGEMTRAMSKVHRWVVSKSTEPVRGVFLDTPAGFELNADDISSRACAYVTEYVGIPCSVVCFKAADRTTEREIDGALRKLRRAKYIFAGPGSPTYAVRNWRGTPVFDLVARRINEGAHLVLASAAAIAVGRHTLPVYEIYKAGEELHWAEGLDLLSPYGLDVAIVSHWNNAEGGTFDTRYCFMGQPRFDLLEGLLPDSTVVLGVDEYTACILDLGGNDGRVMGAGQVTIRRGGHETKFGAGASFGLDLLRGEKASRKDRPEASAETDSASKIVAQASGALQERLARVGEPSEIATGGYADLANVADRIGDLALAVEDAREAGVEENLISRADASLRELVIACGDCLASFSGDKVGSMGPLVEILSDVRSQLRAANQWKLADEIRGRLAPLGIILEDGLSETTWKSR
jgi:cyanophycinase-like exopeptidase